MATFLLGAACGAPPPPGASPAGVSAGGHAVRMVGTAPGVEVEVLDWGGSGPPLLLLAGLGNTAHVYDGFAPLLAGRHRVLALTRRGFGASTSGAPSYGMEALVSDVLAVLDALSIGRAAVVGHSFAGDEITRLALEAPERIGALVYLDAAHDRTGLPSLAAGAPEPVPPPRLPGEDPATVDGWGAYLERVRGVAFPPHELEALLAVGDGGALEPRQGDARATAAALQGLRAPDFEGLAGLDDRVLAIYAVPRSARDMYPWVGPGAPAAAARRAERAFTVYADWEEEQIRRFRRTLPGASVAVRPGASHLIFLSHPRETARAIERFLGGLPHIQGSSAVGP